MFHVSVLRHLSTAFDTDRILVVTSALSVIVATVTYWWHCKPDEPEEARHNYPQSFRRRVGSLLLIYKALLYCAHVVLVVSMSLVVSYAHANLKGSNVIHLASLFVNEDRWGLIRGCQMDEALLMSEPCQNIISSFSMYRLPMLIDTLGSCLCMTLMFFAIRSGKSLLDSIAMSIRQHHQHIAARGATLMRPGTIRLVHVVQPDKTTDSRTADHLKIMDNFQYRARAAVVEEDGDDYGLGGISGTPEAEH